MKIELDASYEELLEFVIQTRHRSPVSFRDWPEFDVLDAFNRPIGIATGRRDGRGRLDYKININRSTGDDSKLQAAFVLPPLIKMSGK